jgi:hypothetical protein
MLILLEISMQRGVQKSLPLPFGWDWLHALPGREGHSLHGHRDAQSWWPNHQDCTVFMAKRNPWDSSWPIETVESWRLGGIPPSPWDCTVLMAERNPSWMFRLYVSMGWEESLLAIETVQSQRLIGIPPGHLDCTVLTAGRDSSWPIETYSLNYWEEFLLDIKTLQSQWAKRNPSWPSRFYNLDGREGFLSAVKTVQSQSTRGIPSGCWDWEETSQPSTVGQEVSPPPGWMSMETTLSMVIGRLM